MTKDPKRAFMSLNHSIIHWVISKYKVLKDKTKIYIKYMSGGFCLRFMDVLL